MNAKRNARNILVFGAIAIMLGTTFLPIGNPNLSHTETIGKSSPMKSDISLEFEEEKEEVTLRFYNPTGMETTARKISKKETEQTNGMNLGTTLYVGGSGPGNYTHIQHAIDNASDGDTVFVYDDSSPYCENIIINKSIDLIGENKDTTIINGSYGGDVIKITVDSVSITRFTIRNSTFGGAGIDIHSSYNNISDNNIISNHNGIKLHYSSNNIFGNTISSNYLEGILLDYSSSNNSICSNKISDNDKGIWLYYSSNNSICSNKILNNSDEGIYLTNSSNNNVSNNKISNTGGGIWLVSSSNNSIFSNNISSNKWEGISLWYSSNNNSISSNNILNNHRGVEIIYNSNFNVIKYNNFIKNDIQAIFKYTREIPHLRPFSNHWNRNYWDN